MGRRLGHAIAAQQWLHHRAFEAATRAPEEAQARVLRTLLRDNADNDPPPGFVALFNGRDLSGWKVPAGDNGHWKVIDGAIDCDAQSESKIADKSLWSEREFG